MTVLDNTPRDQYTATGGQVAFSYTFEIAAEGDIAVLQNGVLLSLGTGAGEYAVTGVGSDTGGVVTLVTGATAGDIITLYRDMALERLTSYTNGGDFLAADVNNDYDRLWLALQQNTGTSNRALVAPNTDPTNINMTIPDKATRLGKYLKFNDTTGNPEAGSIAGAFTAAGMNHYNFTGDGTTVNFTLGMDPGGENNTQVYIDGVYQQKDGYNVSGAVVQFSVAPPNLSTIEVMVIEVLPVGATTASQVSFTQAGSTYGRNVQLKLQESVSVQDFGAVGDGVTDDTAAINAAFAVGGKIYFPSGTYLCSTITLASSDTHIFGSKKSVIKLKNSVNVDLLDLSNFDNITISDLTFDGNKANQTVDVNAVCIRGNGCSNVILQNCTVKNSALTGANIINSDGIKIVNNLFTDCGTKNSVNSGDAMYLAFNTNDYVSGNTVVNPARIGIIIKGSAGPTATNGTVIGNYVINSGENGIGTEDGNARILIVNNVVVDSGDNAFASTKAGIAVGEVGEKVTVSGNIIHNSGSYGIEVTHGADETIVSNNSITSSGAMGIFATAVDGSGGLDNLVITGNNITTTVTDGIFISAALTNPLIAANLNTNISILSNVVRGAARDSIVCSAMLDFNVSNNTIHTTTTASGIRVINSEEGSVSDNYITEVASRGVYLQGAAINCNNVAVKNNTIIDAGTWGVFLIASDNASVMGNTIRNRTGATPTTVGVRSEGAGNANLIVNNDVRGIATGISSTVSGTADTTTPNFT